MELEGIADALKWAVVVLRQPQLHGSSLPPSQPCLCLALKCHRHCLLPFGQWGVGTGSSRLGAWAPGCGFPLHGLCVHLSYFLHRELLPAS